MIHNRFYLLKFDIPDIGNALSKVLSIFEPLTNRPNYAWLIGVIANGNWDKENYYGIIGISTVVSSTNTNHMASDILTFRGTNRRPVLQF